MTQNPIELAKQRTPWWMMDIRRFDGLELHPIRQFDDGQAAEPCDPHDADVWSVFGHSIDGGVECFEDFDTEQDARTFAEQLLAPYPHLLEFGLRG